MRKFGEKNKRSTYFEALLNYHYPRPPPPPPQPYSLAWIDKEFGDLKYKPTKERHTVMKIFAQQDINFTAKEIKNIKLNFGIHFTVGCGSVCMHFDSLAIIKNAYIPNSNRDIIIQVFNTATTPVLIKEGELLCRVAYHT